MIACDLDPNCLFSLNDDLCFLLDYRVTSAKMSAYTTREYANMHLIYGECRCNASAAARLYRERYPNAARYPDHRVFTNVHRLLFSEGHLPNQEHGGGRPANPMEDEVLEAVEEDPSTSVRAIEITTGVPKSTAHRILKRHELHPYHVQRVQTLLPGDYQNRVNFSRTILERYRDDPLFLTKILWSDESTFKKDGYMNMHNLHEWHVENPHLTRQDRSQYRFKVNMWTGILNGQIIGPFELPDALNGEVYLDFLQNHLPSLLEDVPLNIYREMWFQQDGCPAHYARSVRQYLDEEFPGRWIGRSGPISWPARSPDLNPLDFFYWGAVKEKVYSKPIESEFELRQRIAEAAEFVNNGRFARKIARSFLKRCRACIAAEGRHFEHLL